MSSVTVSSTAGLTAALKSATSGDTILLKSGTYSGVAISNLTFAGGVTITSADPNNAAVVTDLNVLRVNGLTFSHIEFTTGTGGFNISSSQNIAFDHDYVHGSLDGSAQNDANGLSFLDTSHVSITNSEFAQLKTAIGIGANALQSISDITVSGNNIHGMEKAGVIMAGASNVNVTQNFISDIRALPIDHPDAIQFFTSGTKVAAHDINISNNVITRGDGDATQGIFLRDQVGTLHFQNVTIADNLVAGTGYGGVYVMGVNGATISGNELISDPGKANNTWMLVQGGDNVTATNNQAQTISFDQVTNVYQSGNVINAPVADHGMAALQDWATGHPEMAFALSQFTVPLTVPTFLPISEITLGMWDFGGGGFLL